VLLKGIRYSVMGSFFSKPAPPHASGMGEDPRPLLPYSSLQFLDLILIRSAVGGAGPAAAGVGTMADGIDARIAAAIRQGSLGLQLPSVTQLSKSVTPSKKSTLFLKN
jgi:hypothetical protein